MTGTGQQHRRNDSAASIPYVYIVLLVIAVLVSYHATLQSPFLHDDEPNIVRNHYIQIKSIDADALKNVFSRLSPSWNRPVASLSFALNHLVGGLDTTGYHVVNIIIHIINGLLLFRLYSWYLVRSGTAAREEAMSLAGLAALIWAVNPIQTNAVTYIVQRMTSLSTMFVLCSLLWYLGARELPRHERTLRKAAMYLAAFGSWLLAMLSKEIAAILPLLLLLHEVFFFDSLSLKRIAGKKILYLAIFTLCCLTVGIYLSIGGGWRAIMDLYSGREFTMAERLLTQPRVVLLYLTLFLMPLPGRLTLFYDYQVSHSLVDPPATIFSLVVLATLVIGGCLTARKYPLLVFGLFWTFICLLIESSILPLEMVYEHRFYLPSVGFALAVTVVLAGIARRFPAGRTLAAPGGLVLVMVLVAMTVMRNNDWRDMTSFHLDAVRKAPRSHRALNGLAVSYMRQGKYDQAAGILRRALELEPGNVVPLVNLFVIAYDSFRLQEAESYLNRIKVLARDTDFSCAHAKDLLQVTEVLANRKRFNDAIYLFEQMADCDSAKNLVYYDNLGLSYARVGRHVEAVEKFRNALELDPQNSHIMVSLARSYLLAGDKRSAAQLLDRLQAGSLPEDLRPYVEKLRTHTATQ